MAFHRIIVGGLLLLLGAGCTTSKWAIIDENAINPTESPEVITETELLIVDEMPTIERPVLKFMPYRIIETEYAERVQIQRTVQEYRPKWGFAILAAAGSALSFTAANTDIFMSGQSTTQRIALNATGALLGSLIFMNLREHGDPSRQMKRVTLDKPGLNSERIRFLFNSLSIKPLQLRLFTKGRRFFMIHLSCCLIMLWRLMSQPWLLISLIP